MESYLVIDPTLCHDFSGECGEAILWIFDPEMWAKTYATMPIFTRVLYRVVAPGVVRCIEFNGPASGHDLARAEEELSRPVAALQRKGLPG